MWESEDNVSFLSHSHHFWRQSFTGLKLIMSTKLVGHRATGICLFCLCNPRIISTHYRIQFFYFLKNMVLGIELSSLSTEDHFMD